MTTRAALDIGSNTVRLLVVEGDRELTRRTTVTGLASGLGRTGTLDPDAVARTLDAVREAAALVRQHDVGDLRVVTTAAARRATNPQALLAGIAGLVGCEPEVLSAEHEGRLAFAGATAGLSPGDGPFAVVDIGGGSTELVTDGERGLTVASLEVGSRQLTESQLRSDPPSAEELANALSVVHAHLDEALLAHPELADARRWIGVGGTVTTDAAVEVGVAVPDPEATNHFELSKGAAEDVFRTLATECLADRVHNPGLPADRADVIVGGSCILVALIRRLGLANLVVSEHDLLDGLLAEG